MALANPEHPKDGIRSSAASQSMMESLPDFSDGMDCVPSRAFIESLTDLSDCSSHSSILNPQIGTLDDGNCSEAKDEQGPSPRRRSRVSFAGVSFISLPPSPSSPGSPDWAVPTGLPQFDVWNSSNRRDDDEDSDGEDLDRAIRARIAKDHERQPRWSLVAPCKARVASLTSGGGAFTLDSSKLWRRRESRGGLGEALDQGCQHYDVDATK
mmetsp:Transcript_43226/g.94220  ORF Transcript_43226/g.94220 Transcript_43226/m.94220 type:complete len:211 (+) Transcript_43226:72-704(+)